MPASELYCCFRQALVDFLLLTVRFNATKQVVEGNLIYVTSNYRLSVFGFFGYPGLNDDDVFNFGVLDQQVRMVPLWFKSSR